MTGNLQFIARKVNQVLSQLTNSYLINHLKSISCFLILYCLAINVITNILVFTNNVSSFFMILLSFFNFFCIDNFWNNNLLSNTYFTNVFVKTIINFIYRFNIELFFCLQNLNVYLDFIPFDFSITWCMQLVCILNIYVIFVLSNNLKNYLPGKYIVDTESCIICYDKKNNWELPCKHKFHKECLQEWFKLKNECPLCRENFKVI